MKDLILKYYQHFFWFIGGFIIILIIFSWGILQNKEFLSKKYVEIAGILFALSGVIAVLSFVFLHQGSSENSRLSKKQIVDTVESAFKKTLEEQKEGVESIQTKVEKVNTLLGDAEDAIKNLGESTLKIEEISDFIAYKNSNREISVFIRHKPFRPSSRKMSVEQIRKFQIKKSKIYTSNVVFDIKIPSITAKYSASEVAYTRLNVSSDLPLLKRNSYSLGPSFQLGNVSNETTVNHRLVIQELSKKFNEIKVGDTLQIVTNKGLIIDSADKKVIIELNDGMRFFCEFINRKDDDNIDSILIYYTLKIVKIKT